MAIITKGSNLQKGNEVEFTLSITHLLAHASVSADNYFSDQSNWDKVFVNYKSSTGNQKEILIFKNVDSGATSTANFGVFSGARDAFEIQSIIIMDKQGGYLHVKRSDLVVADFDVDFSSSGSSGSSVTTVTWDTSSTGYGVYDVSNGGISGTSSSVITQFGTDQASGPCYIEFTPQAFSGRNYNIMGIAMTNSVESTTPSATYAHALAFGSHSINASEAYVNVYSGGGYDAAGVITYAGDGSEVFRIEILEDRVEYSKNGVVFFTDDQSKAGDLNGVFSGHPPYSPYFRVSNEWHVSDVKISGFDEE